MLAQARADTSTVVGADSAEEPDWLAEAASQAESDAAEAEAAALVAAEAAGALATSRWQIASSAVDKARADSSEVVLARATSASGEEPSWLTEAASQAESDAAEAEAAALAAAEAAAALRATSRWQIASSAVDKARADSSEVALARATSASGEEPSWLTEAATKAETDAQELHNMMDHGMGIAALQAEAALSRAANQWVRAGAGAARLAAHAEVEETRAALAEAEASLARMRALHEEAAAEEPEWLTTAASAVRLAKRASSQSLQMERAGSNVEGEAGKQQAGESSIELMRQLGLAPQPEPDVVVKEVAAGSARAARVSQLAAAVLQATHRTAAAPCINAPSAVSIAAPRSAARPVVAAAVAAAPIATAPIAAVASVATEAEGAAVAISAEESRNALSVGTDATAEATQGAAGGAAGSHVIDMGSPPATEFAAGDTAAGVAIGSDSSDRAAPGAGAAFLKAMGSAQCALGDLCSLSGAEVSAGLNQLSRATVASMQGKLIDFGERAKGAMHDLVAASPGTRLQMAARGALSVAQPLPLAALYALVALLQVTLALLLHLGLKTPAAFREVRSVTSEWAASRTLPSRVSLPAAAPVAVVSGSATCSAGGDAGGEP